MLGHFTIQFNTHEKMQADVNLANTDDDAMSPLMIDYLASVGRY